MTFTAIHGTAIVAFVGLGFLASCGSPGVEQSAPASAPAASQAAPVQQVAASGNAVLDRHNALRARHCVAPLQWSDQLAAVAQDWANRCVFEHSTNDLGENLAIGTAGAYSPASHVQSWYDEIADYDYALGENSGGVTGHFTQVVWRTTTQVGCGWARCGGEEMLVCNYAEAGNLLGTYQQNVPPLCQ